MSSLWHDGDISGAVGKAKKLGAIFIVFVEGKNELSAHYGTLFNNEEILKKLKSDQFVAIKVEENSVSHQQFMAVYPHNSIPSIVFIGKNGKVLEIVSNNVHVEEFSTTINEIIEKNGYSSEAEVSTAIIDKEKESEISNTTTSNSKVEHAEPLPSSSKEMSPEEKVQHAQELISQQKEAKKKQEEEAEKLKEIERRKMGQNVQQMKRWQQDEELKQLKEERDREKRENQAARDRVLAQIAQDKAERAAKFTKQGSVSAPSIPQSANIASPRGNVTRLQFRLPDGSVQTHEFQISDTLQTVHQFIMNELNLPFSHYTISTTFPRREYNDSDNSQTLLDLQLVPNAAILILPQAQGTTSSNGSGMVGSMFWWMLAPLLGIYEFIVGFIFGTSPSIARGSEPSTSAKRSASEAEVNTRNQPKRQAGNSAEIKKQGNIHRLKERPDTDDENNTWNGNSTQQM